MFGIGAGEIAVIALAALLLLGPDRLPGLARSMARAYRELTRLRLRVDATVRDLKRELDSDLNLSQFDSVGRDVAGLIPALRDPVAEARRRLPLDQLRDEPPPPAPLPVAEEDDYLSSPVGAAVKPPVSGGAAPRGGHPDWDAGTGSRATDQVGGTAAASTDQGGLTTPPANTEAES